MQINDSEMAVCNDGNSVEKRRERKGRKIERKVFTFPSKKLFSTLFCLSTQILWKNKLFYST